MKYPIILLALVLILSCDKMPEITDDMLDGDIIFDASLYDPGSYLVSESLPTPDDIQKATPVIILCHGYSASTFEWSEFFDWNDSDSSILISRVLLGGHGRTYQDFKEATWQDWKQSILDEYDALVNAGFSNISFAGSSTGGALLVELVSSGYFNDKVIPRNIFLIDPIVIPSNKTLSLANLVGPMLGYITSGNSPEEEPYWYHYRPQETLRELLTLINLVRKDLEKGITLPEETYLKLYKSERDPTADPVSAVLIYNGMETTSGKKIDIELLDSDFHVFTRLDLRDNVTAKDIQLQENVFTEMKSRLIN
ncbi:MAG: esterase [Bacteroidota bacterium]